MTLPGLEHEQLFAALLLAQATGARWVNGNTEPHRQLHQLGFVVVGSTIRVEVAPMIFDFQPYTCDLHTQPRQLAAAWAALGVPGRR
ncbi:hypothetical protein [Hymenobacter cheonanensis]|uniref:hypothetical protein n=1 Tax=Hymenobacter sp. CA2-7 TaxID=3063993 RepID=UPI002712549D|nr:hypothetical protein [Hymenobacter sp. CA2-7]MDO7886642.1 hypothetical protein [Hymenobacter sp. CA2-7]